MAGEAATRPAAHASRIHAADRLLRRVQAVGAPVCVGLDPVLERLPPAIAGRVGHVDDRAACAQALEMFSRGVLDAVRGVVGVVKVQAACFERHGPDGVQALARVLRAAQGDFEVILDFKRGDIGVSAEHYAAAARGALACDWTTVNGYLGMDGIEPFLRTDPDGRGHGSFVLVRTSNPSGDAVQGLRLADGRTVAEAVADMVAAAGAGWVGEMGFSDLGAVVGATRPADAAALRARMPQQVFLVPGYGAQGGGADDVLPCFRADGRGALVTASRSVIYAFTALNRDWQVAVRRAAEQFHTEIAQALGRSVSGARP
jgi:orotidine-5'-phosphate decarboxylase